MKTIYSYINEKLKLSNQSTLKKYNFYPKNFNDLRSLLKSLLKERGPNADLNDIDVSKVTTFYDEHINKGLFEDLDPHNIDISKWNVSNVESMTRMFKYCYNFTGKKLENWKFPNLKNTNYMFYGCNEFDCNLSNWDVSNIINMSNMFAHCYNFTGQGLENWKISKVNNMAYMFSWCKKLHCNLEQWSKYKKFVKTTKMFLGCDRMQNSLPSWYKY